MTRKLLAVIGALLLLAAMVTPGLARVSQPVSATPAVPDSAPTSPVDETKVPHYFGPYPNWANSPLTLPDGQSAPSAVCSANQSAAKQYIRASPRVERRSAWLQPLDRWAEFHDVGR